MTPDLKALCMVRVECATPCCRVRVHKPFSESIVGLDCEQNRSPQGLSIEMRLIHQPPLVCKGARKEGPGKTISEYVFMGLVICASGALSNMQRSGIRRADLSTNFALA